MPTKQRKSGLSTLDLYRLELACQPVWQAFGATYLVGTAQTGGKYRDVDVRTILRDDDFDRRFGLGDDEPEHETVGRKYVDGQAMWALVCSAIGQRLRDQTGLPIDYQIQRMTQANEKYDGSRNPVGHGFRYYAGGGDATKFQPMASRQVGVICSHHGFQKKVEPPYCGERPCLGDIQPVFVFNQRQFGGREAER